jgi:dihydrodipicolinate synthase/N-acetylneuraminate lyase
MMPLDYQLGIQGFNTYFGNANPAFAIKMHEAGLSGDFEACDKLWTDMIDLYNFCFSGDMYRATALGKEMVRLVGLSMSERRSSAPLKKTGRSCTG